MGTSQRKASIYIRGKILLERTLRAKQWCLVQITEPLKVGHCKISLLKAVVIRFVYTTLFRNCGSTRGSLTNDKHPIKNIVEWAEQFRNIWVPNWHSFRHCNGCNNVLSPRFRKQDQNGRGQGGGTRWGHYVQLTTAQKKLVNLILVTENCNKTTELWTKTQKWGMFSWSWVICPRTLLDFNTVHVIATTVQISKLLLDYEDASDNIIY